MLHHPHALGFLDACFDEILEEEFTHALRDHDDLFEPSLYKDNEPPVDILTFIDDPYLSGEPIDFQPAVREILWDIEDPDIREVDLEIGKGSGKSELCITSQVYGVYLLTRMKDPHRFFGLAYHNLIASINVSINREQAKDVVFKGVKEKIESSPYFRSLQPDILTQEVRFPGNISLFCGHSGSKAFLGYATIRAVMDETNYMLDTNNRSQAEELYGMLTGSMKTRAPEHYKLVSVSSTTLSSTWLHQRIQQAQTEGAPYTRRIPMQVNVVTELPGGKLILEVIADQPYAMGEIKHTLDTDHQLLASQVYAWEPAGGLHGDRDAPVQSQFRCMVHAHRKVLQGL